jgi:hypothetical protein
VRSGFEKNVRSGFGKYTISNPPRAVSSDLENR